MATKRKKRRSKKRKIINPALLKMVENREKRNATLDGILQKRSGLVPGQCAYEQVKKWTEDGEDFQEVLDKADELAARKKCTKDKALRMLIAAELGYDEARRFVLSAGLGPTKGALATLAVLAGAVGGAVGLRRKGIR